MGGAPSFSTPWRLKRRAPHHRAVTPVGSLSEVFAHVGAFSTKMCDAALLLRRHRALALGRDIADRRSHGFTSAADVKTMTGLVEIAQRLFRTLGGGCRGESDLLGQAGVARHHLEFSSGDEVAKMSSTPPGGEQGCSLKL